MALLSPPDCGPTTIQFIARDASSRENMREREGGAFYGRNFVLLLSARSGRTIYRYNLHQRRTLSARPPSDREPDPPSPPLALSYFSEHTVAHGSDILFLKHDSSIFRQSSNPVCGFFLKELFGPRGTVLALSRTTYRVG